MTADLVQAPVVEREARPVERECEVRLHGGGEYVVCGRTPVVVVAVGSCVSGHEINRSVCGRCVDLAGRFPLMPCRKCGTAVLVTFVPLSP